VSWMPTAQLTHTAGGSSLATALSGMGWPAVAGVLVMTVAACWVLCWVLSDPDRTKRAVALIRALRQRRP
jgi:hypothetical protein